MRQKVIEEDRQFYVMKGRRNQSEDNITRWGFESTQPLLMPEKKESILEHPNKKVKKYMRVSSQGYLWRDIEK
jgi:hypothetical protein